jgi:L-ascorbate metabolism protein UlaG (beta-lactamase superfamily)
MAEQANPICKRRFEAKGRRDHEAGRGSGYLHFSGDTVWFDGVSEVAQRFPVRTAVLFMGAARVPEVGPFALTMTAEDGIQAAHAFSKATIVPIHYEGWRHLSESREVISRAFEVAGVSGRVLWMEPGKAIDVGRWDIPG